MRNIWLVVAAVMTAAFSTPPLAGPHTHGEGQLYVTQHEALWRFQFILPAADILGFENTPDTPEQLKKFKEVVQRLKQAEMLVKMMGDCVLDHVDVLSPFADLQVNTDHEEHAAHNNPDEKTNGNQSAAKHSEHADIDITHVYRCQQSPSGVIVTLFAWADSLKKIELQWFHDEGQGSRVLRAKNPSLNF